MKHPDLMNIDGTERYNHLLQRAGTSRRVKRLQAGQPGLQVRILSRLGDLLIGAGKRLKMRGVPSMTVETPLTRDSGII